MGREALEERILQTLKVLHNSQKVVQGKIFFFSILDKICQ